MKETKYFDIFVLSCGKRCSTGKNPHEEREVFIRFMLPIKQFYIDISVGYRKKVE